MNARSSRTRIWWKIFCLTLVAVLVLSVYSVYGYFNPYDQVEVKIGQLPENTDFVCLVADPGHGTTILHWRGWKVVPYTVHPESYPSFGSDNSELPPVKWIDAERIGILTCSSDDAWHIAWYEPPKSGLEGRSFLFGQGRWEVNYDDADYLQLLNKEDVESLGLHYHR